MLEKKLIVFVTVLLLLSTIFRFYNFSNLMYWMFDEERDAFVVKRILVDKHPTLIGGAVPGAFYLAPGYFYISTIPYLLSGGNPIGPAILASILGIVSTLALFVVSKEFFNKRTAVFASLIYSVSFLILIYNRTWWPLVFAPIVSLATYWSLYKIVKYGDYRWVIPLSVTLIVGAQSDPSNFSLIILSALVFAIYKLQFRNKYVYWGIFLFIVSHIPLLLFDLRHNFFNTKLVIQMLSFKNSGGSIDIFDTFKSMIIFPQTLARLLYISKEPDVALQIVPFKFYLDAKYEAIKTPILIASILTLFLFALKTIRTELRKENLPLKIIGLHLFIAATGIFIYNVFFPNYIYEWFLQVLFPAFTIASGILIDKLYNAASKLKLAFTVWVLVAFYLCVSSFALLNAKNSYGFSYKSQAVKWAINEVNGRNFSLDSPSSYFSYGGYRYLFYLYGHEPVKSYMDPVFIDWMYPSATISKDHPETIIVIMNPDFFYDEEYTKKYHVYLAHTIARKTFGNIEVLIVDNSDKWVSW